MVTLQELCGSELPDTEQDLKTGLLCLAVKDAFESSNREMAVNALQVWLDACSLIIRSLTHTALSIRDTHRRFKCHKVVSHCAAVDPGPAERLRRLSCLALPCAHAPDADGAACQAPLEVCARAMFVVVCKLFGLCLRNLSRSKSQSCRC